MRHVWNNRLRATLAGAACLAAATLAAVPLRAETLTDALIAAYRNSSLLEQNRAVLRAADEDAALALAALRPTLSFVARTNYTVSGDVGVTSGTIQLSADVTLIDFGRGQFGLEAAREAILATRQALVEIEQQVLLQAVAAFMEVRSANETVALRRNTVRLIEQELQAARDRFDVGEITRTDVAIAEARLAAAVSGLAAAEGDLMVARERYNAAVGNYPGALAAPPAVPRTAASADAAREIARRTHPAIRQGQHTVRVAELNVERAAAAGLGSVNAGATLGASGGDLPGGGGTDFGLSLSYAVPLYSGGGNSALYRQALARRDSARSALQLTTVAVLRDVGTAWANLTVAQAVVTSTDQQIAAAQAAYDGVREEAALGARTTLDVLNAEQELLDARAARITAQAQAYVAAYQLLATMGLLTVDHLNLGIPTYDVEAYYNAVRDAPVTSPQGERLDQLLRSLGR